MPEPLCEGMIVEYCSGSWSSRPGLFIEGFSFGGRGRGFGSTPGHTRFGPGTVARWAIDDGRFRSPVAVHGLCIILLGVTRIQWRDSDWLPRNEPFEVPMFKLQHEAGRCICFVGARVLSRATLNIDHLI